MRKIFEIQLKNENKSIKVRKTMRRKIKKKKTVRKFS
jgi:hypothetical protein